MFVGLYLLGKKGGGEKKGGTKRERELPRVARKKSSNIMRQQYGVVQLDYVSHHATTTQRFGFFSLDCLNCTPTCSVAMLVR